MKTLTTLTALSFIFIASVTYAGTLKGTVTHAGAAPARETMKATKDRHCIDHLKGGKSEVLVVSKGNGGKNVGV